MADTSTLGHVSPAFESFASEALDQAGKWPLGKPAEKLTIPDGEREAIHNLWGEPGKADLHVWLAEPGQYHVDGVERPNFFEVTSLMAGKCIVEEEGKDPVEMSAGDTYVMQPGWTGTWNVTDYVEKAFLWVYAS
jgi:uncharacterized protein